jgi:hypothetical protein
MYGVLVILVSGAAPISDKKSLSAGLAMTIKVGDLRCLLIASSEEI